MNHDQDRNNDYEDDYDDDMDFGDEDGEGTMLRWLSVVLVIAAVAGFVALAWYAYKSGMEPVSEDEIPLVAANDLPYKEKPEDPGGLQFEHQDKSVYNQLATGEAASRPMAERLLPAPEEPVERPAASIVPEEYEAERVRSNVTETVVDTPIPATPPATAPAAAPQESTAQKAPDAAAPKAEPAPVAEPKPAAPAAPAAAAPATTPRAAAPAPAATTTPAKKGQFMAQLGAFSSAEDANAAWAKINAAHGSAFPTKNHVLQRAEVGGKLYHRLQVGPFDSDTAARKVCAYLQERNQACFVVTVK